MLRSDEIGIRMALGPAPARVLRLVLIRVELWEAPRGGSLHGGRRVSTRRPCCDRLDSTRRPESLRVLQARLLLDGGLPVYPHFGGLLRACHVVIADSHTVSDADDIRQHLLLAGRCGLLRLRAEAGANDFRLGIDGERGFA